MRKGRREIIVPINLYMPLSLLRAYMSTIRISYDHVCN